MNYYFPYGVGSPFMNAPRASGGLFGKIFKNGINWSKILNGTQRTLNIINQTIPTIKQITPVVKNAKTMFKVMNEFKKLDFRTQDNKNVKQQIENPQNTTIEEKKQTTNPQNFDGGPVFFVK